MRISTVTTTEELLPLRDAWNQLAPHNPMLTSAWLQMWARVYLNDNQLLVLAVYDDEERLTAVVPWYASDNRFGGRTIKFLGSGDVCSDHMTFICRPQDQARVATCVADWIIGRAASWQLLDLEGVDKHDPVMRLFARRLEEHGAFVQHCPATSSWRLELPDSWDGYLASLSKNRRKKCRRWKREFLDSKAVQIRSAEKRNLSESLDYVETLHQARRNSLGCQGAFHNSRFQRFHQLVVGQLFDEGRLRIAWLEYEGQPVAVEYQLLSDSTVYAYQSGMSSTHEEISAGNLSLLSSIALGHRTGLSQHRLFERQ